MVLREGLSVAEACRRSGVSRPTGHMWVSRAREEGVAGLEERSRRPRRVREAACPEAVSALLALKAERPTWGAKKLLAKLWPHGAPVSLRTAGRALSRSGLTGRAARERAEPRRFERERPNELWQMDFKAVGRSDYRAFSVLDDCSRYCVAFLPLPALDWRTVFEALWGVFAEHGLPDAVLTDNGAPFASARSRGPTPLQARLHLLGVRTLQGRPRHPQTQGKVERFHLTAEQEAGAVLRAGSADEVRAVMEAFRQDYNWERPHEALAMAVPGSVWSPSPRLRPDRLPEHRVPEGAVSRKVDAGGKFTYRSEEYRAGKGLCGERVELREEEHGLAAYFAGFRIAALGDIKV